MFLEPVGVQDTNKQNYAKKEQQKEETTLHLFEK